MRSNQSNLIGNRYQVLSRLGQGGMGIVYRALDRLRGQQVALKSISALATAFEPSLSGNMSISRQGDPTGPGFQGPPPTEQMSIRFSEVIAGTAGAAVRNPHEPVALRMALAHEFRTLASLRHPHIITVLDYGFDVEHTPFFTMELLQDARPILAVARDMAYPQQVELLLQVAQALVYLHRRGVLHRDLKPANILALPTPQGHHIKVLDFGLAIAKSVDATGQGIVGTLPFMAPEVLRGEPPSEAADLYSFGVMAFELMSRRPLFEGRVTGDLVSTVLHKVPDTSTLAVPEPLRDLLNQLLAKTPTARLRDASELCAKLAGAVGRSLPPETSTIRDSFLQAASFVARDEEIAALVDALDDGATGRGSGWLLGGESGVGKSRLIEEVSTLARVRGVQVLRGEAPRAGAAPYQAFRDVLRALLLQIECSDNQASLLLSVVPDLPSLLRRERIEPPAVDAKAAQERVLRTIDDCFGLVTTPTLVVIEDVQWAGVEVILTLSRLMRSIRKRPLVLIVSFRDDEAPWLPSALPAMELLKLARLDRASVTALSQSMLGPLGVHPDLIELLLRETEGNAFFMVEVLRSLAEERGMLSEIASNRLPDRVFAGGMRAVLERRLSRVPAQARPLLQLAAVAGRQLDLPLLRSQEPALDTWLETCANVAVLEPSQGWRFTHDKLRERLLEELAPDQVHRLHRQVAELLEQTLAPDALDPSRLAYHYGEAGVAAMAVHYATRAGERALREGAIEKALTYLSDLPRWEDQIEAKTSLAPGYRLTGSALLELGKLAESGHRFEMAWSAFGYPLPASLQLSAAVAQTIAAEVRDQLEPCETGPQASPEILGLALEAVELARQSISVFVSLSQHSNAYRVGLIALGIMQKINQPALRPFFDIYINYLRHLYNINAQDSIDISEKEAFTSAPNGTVDNYNELRNRLDGLLLLQRGSFDDAKIKFQAAIHTGVKPGDEQQNLGCHLQIAFIDYYRGNFANALRESSVLHTRAANDGNAQFQAWGHTLNALIRVRMNAVGLASNELGLARRAIERTNDRQCMLFNLSVRALLDIIDSNPHEALKSAQGAMEIVNNSFYVSHEVFLAITVLAEVYIALESGKLAPANPAVHASLTATLTHMQRLVSIFEFGRPRALSIESAYALLGGRVRRGAALARLSLRYALRMGMHYDAGLAHLTLSRLAPEDSRRRLWHERQGRELLTRLGLSWPPP